MDPIYLPSVDAAVMPPPTPPYWASLPETLGFEAREYFAGAASNAGSVASFFEGDLSMKAREAQDGAEGRHAAERQAVLVEMLVNALHDATKEVERHRWMIEHGANVLQRERDGFWCCQWSDSHKESAVFHDRGGWYVSAEEAIDAAMALARGA